MSKMRLVITSLALAGYAAGVSAADPSAILQQPTGRVFVWQTTVMAKAQQGMPLYAGNRVVAATGGGAKVIYPDGCAVMLTENSLLTIGNSNQCKAGQAAIHTVGGFQNAPIGQSGQMPPVPEGGAGAGAGAGPGTLMIFGVSAGVVASVAALAGAVALGSSSSKESTCSSPPCP